MNWTGSNLERKPVQAQFGSVLRDLRENNFPVSYEDWILKDRAGKGRHSFKCASRERRLTSSNIILYTASSKHWPFAVININIYGLRESQGDLSGKGKEEQTSINSNGRESKLIPIHILMPLC